MPVGGAIEQIMDLLDSQNSRDYVNQNTPLPAELFEFLKESPAGSSGSISTESEGPGAGLYPAATLPEVFSQVQSAMPEAEARGELNEKSLKEYTDALQIFNSGGKGEKIAGILAALAGTGGYIADRTSGNADRRRGASAELGPALESLFSIPSGMRDRRKGKMESEFDRIDTERRLRGESIGARTTAKGTDNAANLAFRELEQRSAGMRAKARTAAAGTVKEPSQDDKNFKIGSAKFDEYLRDHPNQDGGKALIGFRDSDPKHFAWMAKGNPYLLEYQSGPEIIRETHADVSKEYWPRYKARYDNAIDADERAGIMYEYTQDVERGMLSRLPGENGETISDFIMRETGINTSTPQAGPPPEEPGLLDKAGDLFVGATDAVGEAAGGNLGFLEGVVPDQYLDVFKRMIGGEGEAAETAEGGIVDTGEEEPPDVGDVAGGFTVTAVGDNSITVEGDIDGQTQTINIPMEFSGPVGGKTYKIDMSGFREAAGAAGSSAVPEVFR